jgi:hypothetical protein
MAKKPTWKSRDTVNPFVEKQGSNRKLHTIRALGPKRSAPDLKLGFTTKGGYEYGQTKGLKLWIQAQKSGVPTDATALHTIQVTTGSSTHNGISKASGSLLTSRVDTPFIRFTPRPYRSTSRAIVFNSGSSDAHFLHITSSQYVTLASGTAGSKNKAMSWNVWLKPTLTGSNERQFPSGTTRYIFSKRSGSWGASNREYDLAITMSGSMRFRLFDESAGKTVVKNVDLSISGSAIQAGVWQNVCVTYSGKTGTYTHQGIKIYRNGILVSSGNAGTTESGYAATENKGGDLVIGTDFTGSNFVSGSNFYRGKLAEFGLWHVALDSTEVNALYDARKFFGRSDTTGIDHLRQGVSILTNKQRWQSSNAPKISGISRLTQDERVSHEQDQTLYGQGKIFRDNTPFEEMADAERLRKQIDRTVVGSKASASIEFRGYQPHVDVFTKNKTPALILTGANGVKRAFFFDVGTGESDSLSSTLNNTLDAMKEMKRVILSGSALRKATGSIGKGELWAKAFTSRVNGESSAIQIKARRFGNIVKLTSTTEGTAGNTYIGARMIINSKASATGSQWLQAIDVNSNPTVFGFITGTYNTSSIGSTPGNLNKFAFIGGNSTMKHVVTQALGGAIDYLQDPGHQQYPVIITNVSMRDPAQFDGNIEPLAIRDVVSWGSIDTPFIARTIRGSFMGGDQSRIHGSSQIQQFYDSKHPVSSNSAVTETGGETIAPENARARSTAPVPFIDAQDVAFALPAKPSYAYLRFAKVPHNRDKIILTDTAGRQVCFEFRNQSIHESSFRTGSFGKLRNKPQSGSYSGRGTWCVSLTASNGSSLLTGSTTTAHVARAMYLFRQELALAQVSGRLAITGSSRAYRETQRDPDTGEIVINPSTGKPWVMTYPTAAQTTRTYVRLDQLASGSDGNRVIDFRFRTASTGTYILNETTASYAYRQVIKAYSGSIWYRRRRTRIKFVRNMAKKKFGMSFVSGSDMFILPQDGYNTDIVPKLGAFSDIKAITTKKPPQYEKKANVRMVVTSYASLTGKGLTFQDTAGNVYSASVDSSKTNVQSTSTKIGTSGVNSTAKLARSIYQSIHHSITYGVTAATSGSTSSGGNKLQMNISFTGVPGASGKSFELTQSNKGPEGNTKITTEFSMVSYSGHTNTSRNTVTSFANGTREIHGPASLLTSSLGGTREWTEYGQGYKSAGTGFTYDNNALGTDSIAFGGKKR